MKTILVLVAALLVSTSSMAQDPCVPIPDCVCCAATTQNCQDYVISATSPADDDWIAGGGQWPPTAIGQCEANNYWQAGPGEPVGTDQYGYLYPTDDFGTIKLTPESEGADFSQSETFLTFPTGSKLAGKTVVSAKLHFWMTYAYLCAYDWYMVAEYSDWATTPAPGSEIITQCYADDWVSPANFAAPIDDLQMLAIGPGPDSSFNFLGQVYQAHAPHGGAFVDVPFTNVAGINTEGDTGLVVTGGGPHETLHLPVTWACMAQMNSARYPTYSPPQLIVRACDP